MPRILTLLAALTLVSLPACRSTRKDGGSEPSVPAATASGSPTGQPPSAIRAEDRAAVKAFYQKGGSGGFHLAEDQLASPLNAENSRFIVDLDAQQVYLYQGSRLAAYSSISSGQKYYRTETGDYTIGQKDLNHRSTTYGSFVTRSGSTIMGDVKAGYDPTPAGARFEGALMKYFMRLQHRNGPTAMGFHAGRLPGYPASHGCIRLPSKMAAWFFQHVPAGTEVIVRGSKYGVPYGANQNRPKRAPKVHPSLKKKKPSAPRPSTPATTTEPDSPSPEPAPAPEPAATPDPAPAPEPPLPSTPSIPKPSGDLSVPAEPI
jgi:lipoprotein-anchoring transpeptidase ErfK/SrfK